MNIETLQKISVFEVRAATDATGESCGQKTLRIAKKFFEILCFPITFIFRWAAKQLHRMAGYFILLAQKLKIDPELIRSGRASLISNFNGKEISLKGADGTAIDAMHIGAPGGKIIVFFNGNGSHFELMGLSGKEGMIQSFIDNGYNVLLFNYRGVGRSEGYGSREGLVQDGEAAIKYLKGQGTSEKEILCWGHSLGGAVATEVAATCDVDLCNDRSFGSLKDSALYLLSQNSRILGRLGYALIKGLKWDYEPQESWDRVKGRKWIVHHPRDEIIPDEISLCKAVLKKHPLEARFTTLKIGGDVHNRELSSAEIGEILSHF